MTPNFRQSKKIYTTAGCDGRDIQNVCNRQEIGLKIMQ